MTRDEREDIGQFISDNCGSGTNAEFERAIQAAMIQFGCTHDEAGYAYDCLYIQYLADRGWDN